MSKKSHKLLKTVLFIGGAVGAMYYFNKYINNSAKSKNKLKTDTDSYYEWKEGNIYYKKHGEGLPLLLIHDFSQHSSSYEWTKLIDSLSETHTVYTLDLLGCGRSDKPQINYTNFLYVQMLKDFIHDIIGEKTSIITSGFSSSFAIMTHTYDRSLIDKLIFINPADIKEVNKKPGTFSYIFKDLLELPILGTFIYNLITSKGNIDSLLTEQYFYNPFNIDDDTIETYYESAHRGNGNGKFVYSSIVGCYMGANICNSLKYMENDILIIKGDAAPDMDNICKEYKELNDSIKSATISKTKKLPHFESSEKVLKAIKSFL